MSTVIRVATNPQYEVLRSTDKGEASGDDETIHTGRIVPIYGRSAR